MGDDRANAGIQKLLAAEADAAEVVKAAKDEKVAKLKQAKSEALGMYEMKLAQIRKQPLGEYFMVWLALYSLVPTGSEPAHRRRHRVQGQRQGGGPAGRAGDSRLHRAGRPRRGLPRTCRRARKPGPDRAGVCHRIEIGAP